MIKIKNTDNEEHTWLGQTILPDEYFEIEPTELIKWQNDSKVLSDIGSGLLVVNNGTADITDVAKAINYFKDNLDKFNENGYRVFAPTFEDTNGLTVIWKGSLHTAQPNSLNIYDELVTTQLKLRGGWYRLLDSNAQIGDYLEFSIIDKDDVLGYFGFFGLTVGVDILELKKFIRTEYISPNSLEKQEFASEGASEVMEGLYFRIYYFNSGSNTVQFTITEKYHEA